jgi:hypothetical protein
MKEPIATFISDTRFLSLSFSPEDHEKFRKKDYKGDFVNVKNMQFENGRLDVFTQEEASMLRVDPRNTSNNGNSFTELRGNLEASVLTDKKKSVQKIGEPTDAEKELMAKLWGYCKGVKIDERETVVKTIKETLNVFRVKGIAAPKGDEDCAVLMAISILVKSELSKNGYSANQ